MDERLTWADATEIAGLVRTGQVSPVEVARTLLDRIEAVNPTVNAVVTVAPDVMERAAEAEKAVADGRELGPLHGVPFTIKDCIDTAGVRTTRGSLLFEDRVPDTDATVVSRLIEAGGLLLGKTNMPEFALDADSSNRVFGATENPWMAGRTAGGSSGGEGAAIAAGMSPLGMGSDVGGSIRLPAMFCGIVGLKPTHGRIPLTGHWPEILLPSMHVGPMARSVRDIALSLDVLSGTDGIDPYASSMASPGTIDLDAPLRGMKIAWSAESGFAPVEPEIVSAVGRAAETLSEMGAELEAVTMGPLADRDFMEDHICAFNFEAVPAIHALAKGHDDILAPSTLWFVNAGEPSRERYHLALDRISAIRQFAGELMRSHDALLTPALPLPAFERDAAEIRVDGRLVPKFHMTKTTSPWDYTGNPALAVPFGFEQSGLPIGVQVVGARFDEPTVLRIGAALEAAAPDRGRRPSL